MRLPRDLDGATLVAALRQLGYQVSRQTGGHIRLTTQQGGEHHVTIPAHRALRVGTLAAILDDVALHQHMTRDALLLRLFE